MTAPRAEGTALERAMEALERLRDYFDQRADADAVGDPMRYQGNVEMHRLRDCDELLAALRSREQAIAAAATPEVVRVTAVTQRCTASTRFGTRCRKFTSAPNARCQQHGGDHVRED